MTPHLERFIELVVRPFGERKALGDEACSELMGRLSHLGVPVDQLDVSAQIKQLEAAPQQPAWKRRVFLLSTMIGLVLVMNVGAWMEFTGFVRMGMASQMRWMAAYGNYDSQDPDFWQNLLFSWADRVAPERPVPYPLNELEAERLTDRRPEDLAILQDRLAHRSSTDSGEFMTDEQRDLIQKLDADNALWPLMEARWNLERAGGGRRSYFNSSTGSSDPAAADKAWALFEEASEKSHLVNYALGLQRRQLEAFPKESTVTGGWVRMAFGDLPRDAFGGQDYYYIYGGGSSPLLEKKLSDMKSKEELEAFFNQWLKVMRLRTATPNAFSWDHDDDEDPFDSALGSFRAAMDSKGMDDYVKWIDERRAQLASPPTLDPALTENAGFRASVGDIEPPASVTREELLPGRFAERAWMSRVLLYPGAGIVIIFALLVAFEANRRHAVVQGMARGLMPLVSWRDHAWIAGIGIVLPWAWWWVISRLTPIGLATPDFDDEWTALGWVLQPLLGLITGLVLLTQVVQWRWGKIGEFLGLKRGAWWLGWVAAGVTGVAVPVVGLIGELPLTSDDEKGLFLAGCAGAGSVGLLWLLWVGGMNLFTPRQSALQANVVSRTLRPWAMAGLASMLVAAVVLNLAERYWYARDPLLPTWTSESFTNAMRERICTERQDFLKAIFETPTP